MMRLASLRRSALSAASVVYLTCGVGLGVASRSAASGEMLATWLRAPWMASAASALAASWICMGLACGAAALRQRPRRPRRVAHRRTEPVPV